MTEQITDRQKKSIVSARLGPQNNARAAES
jgi:hypothetical protein